MCHRRCQPFIGSETSHTEVMTVRRLVTFVRRSCAISFKPERARYNSRLERLKLRLRLLLKRDLTPREEQLLELSEPILGSPDVEETAGEEEGSEEDDSGVA
jgi:hypothetical protein